MYEGMRRMRRRRESLVLKRNCSAINYPVRSVQMEEDAACRAYREGIKTAIRLSYFLTLTYQVI